MDTLRISVTELDAYRHWVNEEPWMTTEALIAQLSGRGEPSEKMLAGTAFHEQLENLKDDEPLDDFERNGLTFKVNLSGEFFLPRVQEVKTEMVYPILGTRTTLVGKADAVYGRHVFDHKLTETFDAEKYTDSFQWRAYLVLFDADKFTYNCFTGKEKNGVWIVSELNRLTVNRYAGMEKELQVAVHDLVQFIRNNVPKRLNDKEAQEKMLAW